MSGRLVMRPEREVAPQALTARPQGHVAGESAARQVDRTDGAIDRLEAEGASPHRSVAHGPVDASSRRKRISSRPARCSRDAPHQSLRTIETASSARSRRSTTRLRPTKNAPPEMR
jgi:hypothetical protein